MKCVLPSCPLIGLGVIRVCLYVDVRQHGAWTDRLHVDDDVGDACDRGDGGDHDLRRGPVNVLPAVIGRCCVQLDVGRRSHTRTGSGSMCSIERSGSFGGSTDCTGTGYGASVDHTWRRITMI